MRYDDQIADLQAQIDELKQEISKLKAAARKGTGAPGVVAPAKAAAPRRS